MPIKAKAQPNYHTKLKHNIYIILAYKNLFQAWHETKTKRQNWKIFLNFFIAMANDNWIRYWQQTKLTINILYIWEALKNNNKMKTQQKLVNYECGLKKKKYIELRTIKRCTRREM